MHLVVLQHGMWGTPAHMNQISESIKRERGQSIVVLNSSVNSFFRTYQGIDNGGVRLAEDIQNFVKKYNADHSSELIDSISFIGYSAGGLMCRYCIAVLFEDNFFDAVRPMHFISIATPHLGTRKRFRTFSGRAMNFITSLFVGIYAGRSGVQMALLDATDETPLLLDMSLPGSVYMKSLSLFPHVYAYANASNDNTVPFCTSSLSSRNKWHGQFESFRDASGGYKYILASERVDEDPDLAPSKLEQKFIKSYELGITNILYTLFLFLVVGPFLVAHFIIMILPMRIISIFYYFPSTEKIFPKTKEAGKFHDPDFTPWAILTHLKEIKVNRVVVFIPGGHTHGLVICRFKPNDGGLAVINHIASNTLGLTVPTNVAESDEIVNEQIGVESIALLNNESTVDKPDYGSIFEEEKEPMLEAAP